MMTSKCFDCGKDFVLTDNDELFCSHRCFQTYQGKLKTGYADLRFNFDLALITNIISWIVIGIVLSLVYSSFYIALLLIIVGSSFGLWRYFLHGVYPKKSMLSIDIPKTYETDSPSDLDLVTLLFRAYLDNAKSISWNPNPRSENSKKRRLKIQEDRQRIFASNAPMFTYDEISRNVALQFSHIGEKRIKSAFEKMIYLGFTNLTAPIYSVENPLYLTVYSLKEINIRLDAGNQPYFTSFLRRLNEMFPDATKTLMTNGDIIRLSFQAKDTKKEFEFFIEPVEGRIFENYNKAKEK